MKAYTFTVERHLGILRLCVVDVKGVVREIAYFPSNEDAEIFTETLALVKASAHAHGINGI